MLPVGVTIPATVPQGSEIPEGLMNKPVYKCFFKVLCPVTRSITILDCVLFKENNSVYCLFCVVLCIVCV